MAPLWGEGVSDWTPILEKQATSPKHTEVHILNTKATHAKLKSGDHHCINNNLELALSTIRTTLILPTPILEKQATSPKHTEVHILNTEATHAKLKSGDHHCINNNLDLALSTLRTTLILPTNQEHGKLPKTTTHKTKKYTHHGSNT